MYTISTTYTDYIHKNTSLQFVVSKMQMHVSFVMCWIHIYKCGKNLLNNLLLYFCKIIPYGLKVLYLRLLFLSSHSVYELIIKYQI